IFPSPPLHIAPIDYMHLRTAFAALLGLIVSGANAHGLHNSPVDLINVAYNASIFILPGAQSPATVYVAKNRETDSSSRWLEWYLDMPNRFYTHRESNLVLTVDRKTNRVVGTDSGTTFAQEDADNNDVQVIKLPYADAVWDIIHDDKDAHPEYGILVLRPADGTETQRWIDPVDFGPVGEQGR
ncbi:unnamed protein product, partial [Mycena citricolor]